MVPAQALRDYDRALAIDPSYVSGFLSRGKLYKWVSPSPPAAATLPPTARRPQQPATTADA
jgi:hypothetical protein